MGRRLFAPRSSAFRNSKISTINNSNSNTFTNKPTVEIMKLPQVSPSVAKAAKSVGKKAMDQIGQAVLEKVSQQVEKHAGTALKLATEKGTKIPLNRVHTTNVGGSTKSFTYWGKLTKCSPTEDTDRRYGFFKTLRVGTLAWGDAAADYGQQKQLAIEDALTGTQIRDMATAIRASAWKSHKYLPVSVSMKVNMYNADIAPAIVTIYELVARTDTARNPLDTWADLIPMITAGSGTLTVNDIDALPEWVPGFRKIYKVFRKTTVVMPPGGFHNHVARYSGFNEVGINNVYSQQPTTSTGGTLINYVHGTTTFMFINVKGVTVRTTESTAKVSTSTPLISYTCSRWVKFAVRETFDTLFSESGSYDTIDPTLLTIRESDGDVVTGSQTLEKE